MQNKDTNKLNNHVDYNCLKCGCHTIHRNGFDGFKCYCGGQLVPVGLVYVGIDVADNPDRTGFVK